MSSEQKFGMQTPEESWCAEEVRVTSLEDRVNYFFEEQMPLDTREERLAQQIFEMPHEAVGWLIGFEDYLRGVIPYSVMLDRDPQRAQREIMRHIRKVPLAVLSTLVFNRTLENIQPLLVKNEPLCPDHDPRPYPVTELSLFKNEHSYEIEGTAAAFAHCMHSILRDGWRDTLATVVESTSPYHPVWECFEIAHSLLVSTKDQAKFGNFTAERQCYHLAEDNALVSLELLTHLRMEYAEECATLGQVPSAHGAVLRTMQSAGRIGWAASGNASSIGSKIAADRLARHFSDIEASTAHELRARFPNRKRLIIAYAEDPQSYRYNHPSVATGKWPISRLCPAVPRLKEPYASNQTTVTEWFNDYLTTFQQRFTSDDSRALHNSEDLLIRSSLLLHLAALVGYETIFKNWKY